jgi:hypothetical protein
MNGRFMLFGCGNLDLCQAKFCSQSCPVSIFWSQKLFKIHLQVSPWVLLAVPHVRDWIFRRSTSSYGCNSDSYQPFFSSYLFQLFEAEV